MPEAPLCRLAGCAAFSDKFSFPCPWSPRGRPAPWGTSGSPRPRPAGGWCSPAWRGAAARSSARGEAATAAVSPVWPCPARPGPAAAPTYPHGPGGCPAAPRRSRDVPPCSPRCQPTAAPHAVPPLAGAAAGLKPLLGVLSDLFFFHPPLSALSQAGGRLPVIPAGLKPKLPSAKMALAGAARHRPAGGRLRPGRRGVPPGGPASGAGRARYGVRWFCFFQDIWAQSDVGRTGGGARVKEGATRQSWCGEHLQSPAGAWAGRAASPEGKVREILGREVKEWDEF